MTKAHPAKSWENIRTDDSRSSEITWIVGSSSRGGQAPDNDKNIGFQYISFVKYFDCGLNLRSNGIRLSEPLNIKKVGRTPWILPTYISTSVTHNWQLENWSYFFRFLYSPDGHQLQRPASVASAGTSSARTTNVSMITPMAIAEPICTTT